MAVFLQQRKYMKNFYFLGFIVLFCTMLSCESVPIQQVFGKTEKSGSILYFNPEVYPDIPEIKDPTYTAFYAAVSENESQMRNLKMLRVDSALEFDSVDAKTIKEFCTNNDAQLAMVPKVKYFKVGLGKYVFSNQVVISMKLYDNSGKLLTETSYDTYRKNGRMLGSAENSIRIGTTGALKNMSKFLLKSKREANAKGSPYELF